MLERDGYPAGVPCWVDTGQPDPEAAARFYAGLFGWEMQDRMPAGAPGHYFMAQLRGRDVAGVGSLPPGAPDTPTWTTYVAVDSADDTADAVRAAGGTVLMGPFDVFEAGRMAVIADPEGAVLGVWQARATKGAQLVNEPGTWNFSELYTRDPDGARAFYDVVFGWEAVDLGEGGPTTWCRPGYGDHLAERDPGLRERMSEVQAPDRFEDAVGWLVPMAGGDFPDDMPPHWGITFAVDDADAAVERTTALGGTVLVPPMDAPWVRMAVVRDPQGAVLTVSKFVPPQ